jgi:ferric-dicitrate binding protein FerR (iron transport regulator)
MNHRYLVREIILKYHRGEALTDEEQAILDAEMASLPADKVWERIRSHVEKRPKAFVRALYVRWAAAAAVVIVLAVGLYRYDHGRKAAEVLVMQMVAPGHYHGEVAGMVIDSAGGGQAVPYPVLLPDGSQVTLAYNSSVRYAKAFVKRTVALVGQGFFQVVGNERPFEVEAGKGVVDVLGTEFNWMHYPGLPDEITLYNGKIRLALGTFQKELKPAERAVIQEGIPIRVRVEKMKDPRETLAWKDPQPAFKFDSTDLYTVIQRMAQYYQVGFSVDPVLRTGTPVTGTLFLQWTLDRNIARMADILKDYAQIKIDHGMIEVKRLL